MSDNWPVKWCDTTILQHKFCTMDHKDMMEDPVRMYKGDVWLIISSTSFIQSLTRMHGAEFARLVHARDWMFFFYPRKTWWSARLPSLWFSCQIWLLFTRPSRRLFGLFSKCAAVENVSTLGQLLRSGFMQLVLLLTPLWHFLLRNKCLLSMRWWTSASWA